MAVESICTIEGCGNGVLNKTRGWCSMHYQRWRKHGDPLVAKYDRHANPICSAEGCGEATRAKGLCARHYALRCSEIRYSAEANARHSKHGAINDLALADAAYIAGLIDADGTITVTMSAIVPLPKPLILIVNSNYPLILWLKEVIGAGCSYLTKTRPTRPDQDESNWNKVHRYQVTGWKALSLLESVRPFLRVKSSQADLLMGLSLRGRDFPHSASPDQLTASASIGARIRELNRRGLKVSSNGGYKRQL